MTSAIPVQTVLYQLSYEATSVVSRSNLVSESKPLKIDQQCSSKSVPIITMIMAIAIAFLMVLIILAVVMFEMFMNDGS